MPYVNDKYYTDQEIREIRKKSGDKEFNEFLVSGIVGFTTGSWLTGALLGGDLAGGVVGDLLEDFF